jgi:AraC family transcriptional regulator of adaptative response/methylated-DNA-[protein]-cysteine methyltransferase
MATTEKQGAFESSRRRLWKAVASRDSSADGKFVYGVRSTGVYCRPSCPSRRPKSVEGVDFFPIPQAAEQCGFRACRRCRPGSTEPSNPALLAITRICRAIDAGLGGGSGSAGYAAGTMTLSKLGAAVRMSPHQLERTFRRFMGITPRQYADARRMKHLKRALRKGDNVTTALYEAGFGSSSRLYERAPSQLGMTPNTYRRGGAGMQIHYTIVDSPLGKLLLAATDKGVSALYLGKSADQLTGELREEYPRAELVRDGEGPAYLQGWVGKVLAHLKGREPHLDLPTDVQATAFQRRVWEELRRIPYGTTRTYTQVARAIGKPSAIRAVARACATNPVSVIVPCHRVVREDGNLAGYRWGLDRKQRLIEQEADVSNS